MRRSWRIAIGAAFVALVSFASLVALDRVPAPWWDEGWTLNVARNWVERGWYGQLLNGEPAPPGLPAAFPTVASVALSFNLFGVGIWQGRLAIVMYAFAALALLFALAARLYDRRVAAAAVILTLITAADPALHPIVTGRQVLAEMPMLVFLLIGYLGLWWALQRSWAWLLLAIGAWGLVLQTKVQPLPFWAASLLAPGALALVRRQWRLCALLAGALIGSFAASRAWSDGIELLVRGRTLSSPQLAGLGDVTALVSIPQVRLTLLVLIVQIALPTVLGLVYVAWRWLRRTEPLETRRQLLRLSVWALAASWFGWYALLSRGSPRYAFPAVFFGSIFVAVLLSDLTDRFNFPATVGRLNRALKTRRLDRRALGALLFFGLLAAMLVLNAQWALAYAAQAATGDRPLGDVVDYLNTQAPPGALIETYDSELFVLLDRPYHYPPDQTSVALIRDVTRRNFGLAEIPSAEDRALLNYDPLAADPDYVVVGPPNELWRRLYDPVLAAGAFRRVFANRQYEVYERVR
jgi:hypothetical protein